MNLEQARGIMEGYLRENFGRLVFLQSVEVVRSSSGRIWRGKLGSRARSGTLEVGQLTVSSEGQLISRLSLEGYVDRILELGRQNPVAEGSASRERIQLADEDFADLGLRTFSPSEVCGVIDGFDSLGDFFAANDFTDLRSQIITLLSSGNEKDLLKARDLLPQLLSDPERRGLVLRQMGELEMRLRNPEQARDYFEASACELADQARIEDLQSLYALACSLGNEIDVGQIRVILDQCIQRMLPIDDLAKVPAFVELGEALMAELRDASGLVRITKGVELLKEGDPATHAFVIQSGVLSVRLKVEDGEKRLVRCCYPGDFIGESSVLEPMGSSCNATLTAERETILWQFEGTRLRQLIGESSDLHARIIAARELHCLDSFFSMHQITNNLHVQVRDHLLGCVSTIRRVPRGAVLGKEGVLPEEVYLLALGGVECQKDGRCLRKYEMDSFIGLSDALHELPLEGDLVAIQDSRVVVFDIDMLKGLVAQAPPEVAAVMERLG